MPKNKEDVVSWALFAVIVMYMVIRAVILTFDDGVIY